MSTIRGNILAEALSLTEGARNQSYGDPTPNMKGFAKLVEAYLSLRSETVHGDGTLPNLDAVDGAIIMCLSKIARIAINHTHRDSYVDLSAYAGIAGECAEVIES